MHDTIILYCYHQCDELTVRHLDLLERHNPKHVVIPVIGEPGGEELPDGHIFSFRGELNA